MRPWLESGLLAHRETWADSGGKISPARTSLGLAPGMRGKVLPPERRDLFSKDGERKNGFSLLGAWALYREDTVIEDSTKERIWEFHCLI